MSSILVCFIPCTQLKAGREHVGRSYFCRPSTTGDHPQYLDRFNDVAIETTRAGNNDVNIALHHGLFSLRASELYRGRETSARGHRTISIMSSCGLMLSG